MGSILGDRVPTQKTAKPMRLKNPTGFQLTPGVCGQKIVTICLRILLGLKQTVKPSCIQSE
jgi:hypothetical protein